MKLLRVVNFDMPAPFFLRKWSVFSEEKIRVPFFLFSSHLLLSSLFTISSCGWVVEKAGAFLARFVPL